MASYGFTSNTTFEDTLMWRTLDDCVPYMPSILDKLPPNFVLLDVGCGPGTITCDFASRYPSATILGFDYSPHLVEVAKKWAQEKGVSNVRFAVGDVLDLPALARQPGFEAVLGGCDVVHAHQVLLHSTDIVQMLRKMREAAKPEGGYVCSRDLDCNSLGQVPYVQNIDVLWCVTQKVFESNGSKISSVGDAADAVEAGFDKEKVSLTVANWDFRTDEAKRNVMNIIVTSVKDPKKVAQTMLSWLDLELISCTQLQALWAGYGHICAVQARPAKSKPIPESWQPFSTGGATVHLILKLIAPAASARGVRGAGEAEDEDDDEGHLRKMLSYRVEQCFYDEVAPRLGRAGAPVAACLASTRAMPDLARRDGIQDLTATLMSDLRLQYPLAGEKRAMLSETQVDACLDWLAAFHAASWKWTPAPMHAFVLPPLEEIRRKDRGTSLWLNGGYTYLATRRDEYGSLARDRASEWHDAFCVPEEGPGSASVAEKVARFLTPTGRAFEMYIHGDVKSENLFSTTAGDRVAFFDFQYVGLGLGVCDLAKLFTCSVPLEMLADSAPQKQKRAQARKLGMSEGERALLERYRAALMRGRPKGKTFEYGWDELVRHWETALVDWCRFQASWGFWGNTAWLQARVRAILGDEGWRAWLDSNQ
ncbi:putative methyltransferase [Escovopsis weberi]|uniref:Putative methyltransferase n=1 Tax=Escovopsis weberi TaxID=150374 RepID=A0A0M8N053_ESCWE|nr:putative methyltransferase [Escovopsis weberi]